MTTILTPVVSELNLITLLRCQEIFSLVVIKFFKIYLTVVMNWTIKEEVSLVILKFNIKCRTPQGSLSRRNRVAATEDLKALFKTSHH